MEQPKKFRAYGRKLLQFIFVLLGGSLGATYFPSLWQTFNISNEWLTSHLFYSVFHFSFLIQF